MAARVEGLLGQRIAKGMWILTFHSACARILRREHDHLGLPVELHDLRRGGHRAPAHERPEGPEPGSQAVPAPGDVRGDRQGEGQRPVGRRVRADGGQLLRADDRERVRGVREAQARRRGARLRRPDHRDRPAVPRPPRGARALPGAVPLHPRRRVPGHEPRAVPAGQPAGGEVPERLRRGRRRPGRLLVARGHDPEPPGLRARLPRRRGLPDGAELPLHPEHPRDRERADRAQRPAQAQVPVDRDDRGRARGPLPRGRRARGGAVRRRGDPPARRGRGAPVLATSRSSTGRTPRAACSRTSSCGRASRTASSAACGSTSARRSRTSSRTCGCC